MNEPDQADAQAESNLPDRYFLLATDRYTARQAVAAALREQWQAIDSRDRRITVLLRVIEAKDKELADLRAENEWRRQACIDNELELSVQRVQIDELKARLAELEKKP